MRGINNHTDIICKIKSCLDGEDKVSYHGRELMAAIVNPTHFTHAAKSQSRHTLIMHFHDLRHERRFFY